MLDMCSKPIFCSKIAQKDKGCSRLPEQQKVAPNDKSCSKVAEHNRQRPTYNIKFFKETLIMILLPDVFGISSSQDLGTYHTIKIGRAEKQKLCKISGDK